MECRLDIVAGYKEGKSYVKNLYVGKPFRVVSVGQRKTDNKLYQMMMTSSPGILDGDEYVLNIDVEDNAALQLQSQSYQRLFNMADEATQQLTINIHDNSSFAYVPHPVVPHENSNFKSKASLTIGDQSQLIISEIITCGRKHSGEVFKMKCFQNLTEIYHNNKLVVKDNILIQPELIPIESIGILENYTHQGSLIFYSTKTDVEKDELVNNLFEVSKNHTNIEVGISVLDDNGFVIRALSQGGEAMYKYFLEAQDLLWEL